MTDKPIINIQLLRAFAALAVLFYHFSIQYQLIVPAHNNFFFELFNWIGYAGVDFFFVISGYIMWVTTHRRTTNKPVWNFVYKRLCRIYLGYWPYFLLAVLIITCYPQLRSPSMNLWGSFWLTELNTNQLLIQVAWTLQFELYFYTLFTLLLLFPEKLKLPAVWLAVIIITVYQIFIYSSKTNSSSVGLLQNFLLSPYCLQFFAGCLLAKYLSRHQFPWKLGLMAFVLLMGFAVYYQSSMMQQSLIDGALIIPRVLIFGTAACLLLACFVELEKRGTILMRRTALILGGSSYSIYLSHTLAIALIYVTGLQSWIQTQTTQPFVWLGLLMALTIAYSILHYLAVEKPLMHASQRLRKIWLD